MQMENIHHNPLSSSKHSSFSIRSSHLDFFSPITINFTVSREWLPAL